MNKLLLDIYSSKSRTATRKLPSTFKISLNKLINKSLDRNMNFNSKKNLSSLTVDEILKLRNNISTSHKKNYVDLLFPIIKKLTPKHYFDLKKENIRPSLQVKYKWDVSHANFNRKVKYKNDIMYESYKFQNFEFPTRPHQDLENNGFRSTSTLIYYFQITKSFKSTSNLQVSNFKRKPFLINTSNKWNYHNQIEDKYYKNNNWFTPSKLNNNHVFIMDAMTPHCSSLLSEIPRLAINVKIHPNSIKYISKKLFNIKKNIDKNSKFKILESELIKKIKTNNAFYYELGLLMHLSGNIDKSYNFLEKLFDKKIDKRELDLLIIGGYTKKSLRNINKVDFKNLYNNNLKIEKNSCCEALNKFLS